MVSSGLVDYYQEVFNFVSSLTIKFSPMADSLNQTVANAGFAVDETTPTTWKYYLNLVGQYHTSDTLMYINSLDTQQQILFSPTILPNHPKTTAAYVPGNLFYTELCNKYPNQVDLIKSIVYPVPDINLAILADDFTILAYGTNLLETDEYDPVLQILEQFFSYVNRRWYFNFFSYEAYYTWTFWGLLWQQIVQMVLLVRIQSIKTTSVHSWHIWQYLASYGLSDYSDVLSRTQALFLYRNIAYIIANRGKQKTLVILADNLLSGLGVGLYGLDIWQQTTTGATLCQLTPELVPVGIPTTFINALPAESAETIAQVEQRLFNMGTEVNIAADYIASLTVQLGTTPINTMPTKLLELRQISTDLRFAAFLNCFLLDSLVYAIANNKYSTIIDFVEPTTSISLNLSVNQALLLYSYCAFKALGQQPTTIPTQYSIKSAFSLTPTIPTTLVFDGYTYPLSDFTNVTNYLGSYAWPTSPCLSPTEFSACLSTQFQAAMNQIQISRMEEDRLTNKALNLLSNSVTVQETISLSLSTFTTYDTWLAAHSSSFGTMFSTFDAQTNPLQFYDNLAQLILSNLLPATPTFSRYGNFAITNTAYAKFKQLFVQLCSYNILFLDTDTIVEIGVFLGKMSSYAKDRVLTRTYEFPLESPMLITHTTQLTQTIPPIALQCVIEPDFGIVNTLSGGINVSYSDITTTTLNDSPNLEIAVNSTQTNNTFMFDINANQTNYVIPIA